MTHNEGAETSLSRCRDVTRLTYAVNTVHSPGLTLITGPSGSLESRMATSAGPAPTSTQLPLERLWADFRQFMIILLNVTRQLQIENRRQLCRFNS